MATISQRIALEGGDDIKKVLEELGAAGEKSFKQIQDAAEKTKIDAATQKSFEDLVGAGSQLEKQFLAIAEATSKSSPGLDQVSKNAASAAEGLAKIGEVAELLVGKLSQIAEAVSAAQSNIDQVAKSAPPAAEQLTALGDAGKKTAEGMVTAGGAIEQASGQVAQSSAVTQDAVRFWSLFALEVVKTGAAVGQTVAALEEATASAGKAIAQIGLAIAALGLFALELGKTVASALTPHITEQSDALVKAALEYDKTRAEIAKLNAEASKLAGVFDNSAGSIAKASSSAAKAAEDIAKVAVAGEESASAFVQTGLAGAQLYETLVNLSKATGQSITELQVGQQAFEHIGVAAEAFGTVLTSLQEQLAGLHVGSELAASGREVEAALDKADAAYKRVLETQKALLEAQIKLDEAGGSRAPYDASQRLADINRQLLELTSGRTAAEKTLRDAQNAAADAADASANAQIAHAKAVATSLATTLDQVNAIIAGQKDIKFDEATPGATKINAVQIALKQVSEQAKATGVDVVQALVTIIANAPDLKDALAIGKQFGIDEAAVNSIRQYNSEASNVADTLGRIPNLFQKIREGGVAIGPEAAANFDKVKQSTEALEDATLRLSKAWAAIFPPTQKLEEFKQKQIELGQVEADAIARQDRLKAAWVNLGASILEVGTKIVTTMGTGAFWKAIIPQPVANAFDWIATSFFAAIGRVQAQTQSTTGFISAWVTTPITNAWQWIVDTFGLAVSQVETKAQPGFIEAWVTTPAANAWEWVVDTFNSAVASLQGLLDQAMAFIEAWVTTPAASAWQWIVDTFNSAVASLLSALDQGTAAITAWVTTPIANAWQWIVDAWNAMLQKLGFGGGGSAAPAGGAIPGGAGGGLLGGRGSGTSDSNLVRVSRGEYIVPARIVRQPGVLAFLEALRRSGRLAGHATGGLIPAYAEGGQVDKIGNLGLGKLLSALEQTFNLIVSAANAVNNMAENSYNGLKGFAEQSANTLRGISNGIQEGFKTVDQTLEKAGDILKRLRDAAEQGKGNASGGLIGGRGTGTSDSNLAWVSRGEHIMPARAVSQPGVLAFLEALRRSGGDLRDVLDGMGQFALGGLVAPTLSLPAFAGGGAMNNVTIQFPGLPEITGLRASSAVVDELRKAAAMAQVRSGGRKPSRYS